MCRALGQLQHHEPQRQSFLQPLPVMARDHYHLHQHRQRCRNAADAHCVDAHTGCNTAAFSEACSHHNVSRLPKRTGTASTVCLRSTRHRSVRRLRFANCAIDSTIPCCTAPQSGPSGDNSPQAVDRSRAAIRIAPEDRQLHLPPDQGDRRHQRGVGSPGQHTAAPLASAVLLLRCSNYSDC